MIKYPLPPGCLSTLWENDAGFEKTYFERFPGFYQTSDAGHIDEDSLLRRIDVLTDGTSELSFHPASGEGPPRPEFASWDYRWDLELAAVTSARVRAALEAAEIQKVNFRDLV